MPTGEADSKQGPIEIGDEVLVNGRKGTVLMVGQNSVRVEYKYGSQETVRKLECQTEFEEQEVEEEKISVEFERFTGKKAGSGQRVEQPKVRISNESIQFNNAAVEAGDLDDYNYVNYFLSDDPDIFGVKPVEGGDVDGDSYRINDGTVSFTNVRKTLGLQPGGKALGSLSSKVEAYWDGEEEMFVIDVSSIRSGSSDE